MTTDQVIVRLSCSERYIIKSKTLGDVMFDYARKSTINVLFLTEKKSNQMLVQPMFDFGPVNPPPPKNGRATSSNSMHT